MTECCRIGCCAESCAGCLMVQRDAAIARAEAAEREVERLKRQSEADHAAFSRKIGDLREEVEWQKRNGGE